MKNYYEWIDYLIYLYLVKLEWLRSFAAFAESLNFTHAAEALHVSQPALHVQIQKLAEALGVPLYRKVGRELVLTVEGEKLAAFALEIEERSAEFIDELATGSSRRRVVLCAGEGAFLYLLGPTIRSFTKKEPTALELMTVDAAGTLDAVRSGKAHIGVLSLERALPDLTTELMMEVPHMIATRVSGNVHGGCHPTDRRASTSDGGGAGLPGRPW